MSTKDAVYYSGLIAGIIVGSLAAGALGVTGILQLLAGIACGVGFGFVAEQTYSRNR